MKARTDNAVVTARTRRPGYCAWLLVVTMAGWATAASAGGDSSPMPAVRVNDDASGFVLADGRPFIPWGFNYDHDEAGRLIEDYWFTEWPRVEQDFHEMHQLGANAVRVHLQFGRFMRTADEPNQAALDKLGDLLRLAERERFYLDLTGLGCYHKADVPPWYDALSEQDRWGAQACFWQAIAGRCAESPVVFCYDLMNEPIVGGQRKEGEPLPEWLAGAFGDKHFVQRITLDLAGRTQQQVAKAWVDRLVAAIRKHDRRHAITVGVIPWALTFPGAKPLFYSKEVGENLDFASVHFYPETDKIDRALAALAVYDIGKPLVIEEMFFLKCPPEQFEEFLEGSRAVAEGWIGFYWGKTPDELRQGKTIQDALLLRWLDMFQDKAAAFRRP